MELRNLGKGKDANSRISTLIIRRTNFDLFRHLLGRDLWDKFPEVSPRELTNFKGWSPFSFRMNNSETHRTTERQQVICMDQQGAPAKILKIYVSGSRVRVSQQSKAVSKLSPPRYLLSQKFHDTALEPWDWIFFFYFLWFFSSCLVCCAILWCHNYSKALAGGTVPTRARLPLHYLQAESHLGRPTSHKTFLLSLPYTLAFSWISRSDTTDEAWGW